MIAVPSAAPVDAASAAGGTGAFQSMLEGMIGNVEQSQTQASQAAQNFLSGGDEELHSVALAAIVGVIVMMYAYVFPHLIPHGLTFVR